MDVPYPNCAFTMIIVVLASLSAILVLVITLLSRFHQAHRQDLESGLYTEAVDKYPDEPLDLDDG